MNADRNSRHGLTIVEVMVAMGVVGILAALILPAVSHARDAARRTTCRNHLRQIGVAIHAYESAHGCFPPAGVGAASSYLCRLVPYVEKSELVDQANRAMADSLDGWDELRMNTPAVFKCPADPGGPDDCWSSYAGNSGTGLQQAGFNGFFRYIDGMDGWDPGGVIRAQNVDRGLSRCAAVSEFLVNDRSGARARAFWELSPMWEADQLDAFATSCNSLPANPEAAGLTAGVSPLGWDWTNFNLGLTLYNHVLPPNAPRCNNGSMYQLSCMPAGSQHPGGAHTLYGDGHCEFTADHIDLAAWRLIGSRTSRSPAP